MSLEILFKCAQSTLLTIKNLYANYTQSKDYIAIYKNSFIIAIAYSLEALSGILSEGSCFVIEEQTYSDLWIEPMSFKEAMDNINNFLNSCDEMFKQYKDEITRFPYTSMGARCGTYFCLLKDGVLKMQG